MKKRMMKEWMTDARERFVRQGEIGRTYLGCMGHSAKRVALVAAALLSCAGISAGRVSAEGTRDIMASAIKNAAALGVTDESQISRWSFRAETGSFMGVSQQQKVKFYAYEDEVIFFGSNAVENTDDVIVTLPDGSKTNLDLTKELTIPAVTGGGYIQNRAMEKNGPNGVILPGTEEAVSGGFTPYKYVAPQSGVYVVEFKADNAGGTNAADRYPLSYTGDFKSNSKVVFAWDITVTQPEVVDRDKKYKAVNGRVWVDALTLQTKSDTCAVYGDLYAVTRDGYIWRFSMNGMNPYTISMYANARGNIGSGTNASAYHSIHQPMANDTSFDLYKKLVDKNGNPDGIYILGPDNEVTDIDAPNHMFLNKPDTGIPDSIIKSKPDDMGSITGFRYDGRDGLGNTDTDSESGNRQGYVGVGGYFEVDTQGASSYRVIIDMSNMYAKHYHGEKDSTCKGSDSHKEEICLGTSGDESDDNFIYYDQDKNQWFSIRSKSADRHPTNLDKDLKTNPTEDDFKDLVDIVKISKPDGYTEAGADFGEYKCLGRILLGNAAVDGENRVYWNGRDQYGRILPVGTYFGDTGRGVVYAEPKAGEIHFPLGDVEMMAKGVAVYLENAPNWVLTKDGTLTGEQKSYDEQVAVRSKVYYNNLDKSLLRDFTVTDMKIDKNSTTTTTTGNNAWYWNLPGNVSNSASGEKEANGSKLNREWVEGNAKFEDQGIDGVVSYQAVTDGGVTTQKQNGQAGVIASNGIDHGIADMWTHIVGTNQRKELKSQIYLYHYANQKIITGFVYLDTPKVKSGLGLYDKLTDDHELKGAVIKAKYGEDSEGKPIEYETVSSSNGYYSIPVNMDYFTGTSDAERNVEITVTYEDPNVNLEGGESSFSTYKVTTAGVTVNSKKTTQKIVGAPNVSVQKVSLEEEITKKEIYAEDVGYTNNPSDYAIRIVKEWAPEELKDNSMSASFIIRGIKEEQRTDDGSGSNKLPVEEDPKFGNLDDTELPDTVVYQSGDVTVDEALGGIAVVDSLPRKAYMMPSTVSADGITSNQVLEGEEIAYCVFEKMEGSEVDSKLVHGTYTSTDTTTTYDNWQFTNTIVPSDFTEIVWYDENNNGIQDDGELPIANARIEIVKLNEKTLIPDGGDEDDDSRYTKDFQYAVEQSGSGSGADKSWKLMEGNKLEETQLLTNDKGEFSLPDSGKLIAGRYRVKITLPADSLYNTATFTSNGLSALKTYVPEPEESKIISQIKGSSTGTEVTQYFNVGVGGTYEARAGYGFMGGLSIRKNVDVTNVNDADDEKNKIIEQIEEEEFTFEIQFADKPNGDVMKKDETEESGSGGSTGSAGGGSVSEESVTVTVETFELDMDTGSETPAKEDKKLTFKKITFQGQERWSSIFKLKAGERITIPNVNANEEYWLWEYDNTNEQAVSGSSPDMQKMNGSSTDTGSDEKPLTYMPKGYSLAQLVGSKKMREGQVPSTSRTVLVSYTNVYNPLPVDGFGGDGTKARAKTESPKFDVEKKADSSGETVEADIDHAFKISADVKIVTTDSSSEGATTEPRYFEEDDQFKLLLEAVGDAPGFEQRALDVKPSEEQVNAGTTDTVTAWFSDDSYVTFATAGEYSYTLREARPFYDDDVTAIPGISYATEQYKMVVTVEDVYQQLKITSVKWYQWDSTKEKDGAKGDWTEITESVEKFAEARGMGTQPDVSGSVASASDQNPIVFTNTYNPYSLTITIAGRKILETGVTGVDLDHVGKFSFELTPGGVKNRASEDDTFNEKNLNIQPMPEGSAGTSGTGGGSGTPSAKTQNVDSGEEIGGDNVVFGQITFTADDAGSDLEHAEIYRYFVGEVVPGADEGAREKEGKWTKDGITYDDSEPVGVYIRVYKEAVVDANGNQMQTVVAEMCDDDGDPLPEGDDFVFTNSYAADTEIRLKEDLALALTKTIQTESSDPGRNRGFKDGDKFIFVLEPQDGAPTVEGDRLTLIYSGEKYDKSVILEEDEKKESLSLSFDDTGTITFTNPGTYTYVLRELDPLRGEAEDYSAITGFSYDATSYTITIEVSNKDENDPSVEGKELYKGKLEAKIVKVEKTDGQDMTTVYDADAAGASDGSKNYGIEFVNIYSPDSATVTIAGRKVLACDDPDVTLDDFKDGDSNGAFRFRLMPAGQAQYTGTDLSDASFTNDNIANQPMPSGTVSDASGKEKSLTVSNKGASVSFAPIRFTLENVKGTLPENPTSEKPVVYRYMVEELLTDSSDESGVKNAADAGGNPILGTGVDEDTNQDGNDTTEPNQRYVYIKAYIQEQDGTDHVVVRRCDSTGKDIATSANDFTITNIYTVAADEVELSELLSASKTLVNNATEHPLPENAVFGVTLEPVAGEPAPTVEKDEETEVTKATATIPADATKVDTAADGEGTFALDKISLTFEKAGTYQYVLRELDPFSIGDKIDPVPGVSYDTIRYRLTIKVTNNLAGNRLETELTGIEYSTDGGTNWSPIGDVLASDKHYSGTGSGKKNVKFVNVYNGSSAAVNLSGYKVLEGSKKLKANEFEFAIDAVSEADLSDGAVRGLVFQEIDDSAQRSALLPKSPDPKQGNGTAVNGKDETTPDIVLARGVVDFGTVTFEAEQAGEDAAHAKIYKYEIKETIPDDAEKSGEKWTKEFPAGTDSGAYTITYDSTVQTLYIRVYKIEVNSVQTVVAEFCNEIGQTDRDVSTDFTFTNLYTSEGLEVPVDELLKKAEGEPVGTKILDVKTGAFDPDEGEKFSFVFHPTSYPQIDAPVPHDKDGNEIPVLTATVDANKFKDATKDTQEKSEDPNAADRTEIFDFGESLGSALDGDSVPTIIFRSEGKFTYRIRELNPNSETDRAMVAGLGAPIDDVAYDTSEYTLTVTVTYDNGKGEYSYAASLSKDGSESDPASEKIIFTNTFTEHHTLTYDGNFTQPNRASDVPASETREVDASETLSGLVPVYTDAEGRKVVFIGWSAARVEKVLDKTDRADVLAEYYKAGERFTMPNEDTTLYAIWGYDENNDGMPDVLEGMYELRYDGNAPAGETDNVPEIEHRLAGVTFNLSGKTPTREAVDVDGVQTDVLFVGWSTEKTDILSRDDFGKLPESFYTAGAEYTMPAGNTTLYAVWSYDTNGDGTPDALEERYHVFYDVNPVMGRVNGKPSDGHAYLTDERAVLADGVTVKDVDDSLILLPTHDNLTLNGREEKIVFIGWTRVKTAEVYTQESVRAPVTVASVTFGKDDITVYAAWGYDVNDNGIPDVMERQFILTYHGNAQESGAVSGMPDPASVTGILMDTSVKLSDVIPAHMVPSGDTVLFEGWSTTQTGKIFDVTDADPLTVDGHADGVKLVIPEPGAAVEEAEDNLLLAPGTVIEKVRGNINLYAVWAKDVNRDGVPDYKEGLLEYVGNPIEGMTGDLPANEVHPLETKTALSKEQPRHSEVEHRKVVFIGWTLEKTDRIYDREDHDSQPECVEEAVVTKHTKVYAAWGYDRNNNGTADVLEEQYTLSYDGNAQKGTFSKLPEPVSGLLDRETVTLVDGETVTDATGAVIPRPEHSSLMLNGKETKVLFVGWTLTPADRIYTINDEPPADFVTDVTILHADRTVYAAWGYDETENNIPDILENYVLQYNGNALVGSVKKVPEQVSVWRRGDVAKLVDGETVTDVSKEVIPLPEHSPVNGLAVLFLGWTTEENDRIYEAGDTAPACVTEVVMNNRLVTVYAAWGLDRDGKGIPDVYEDYTLSYDGNEIVRGAVHNVPRKVEGLSYGDKVPLKNAEGGWLAAPEHDPLNGVPVVFVGWTREQTSVIYSRYDDAPECLEEAVMDQREVTVYAAWGLDTNDNGTADVLENYSLFYEGNAKGGGTVDNLPLSVTGLLADETVTLSSRQPTHTPVEQNGALTEVLFLGWTDQQTQDIFSTGDTVPELLTEVTLHGADRTVYAAWGYDEDDSGTPDVWENYTLVYHGNAITGNVDESTLPPAKRQLKRNDPVTLSEEAPKHETVNGRTVAFLGWTLEPTDRIYERGDDREEILQRLVTSVVMETMTVDVYAAWGYDENGGSENPDGGNGTADVLENTYLLTYNGNPLIGDADGIPEDKNGYLVNERITLSTKTPTHSDVEGRTVVFLGWTLEPSPMIYEGAGKAAAAADGIAAYTIATGADGPLPDLIETVEMEEGGMTVYAAWGYVTNQVTLPLILTGKKVIVGKEQFAMKGGEFGFAVTPASANPASDPVKETVVSNAADGSIPLIDAVYRETGTYQYTIRELDDSEIPGMQCDDSVYELTVTVTGSGRKAQADIAITKNGRTAESILFENTYAPAVASVSIEGRKTLTGRALESGEFTFVLEPVSAEMEEEAEVQNPVSAIAAAEDAETELAVGTEPAAEITDEPETESESVNETESELESESEPAGETQPETSEQSEMLEQIETPEQSETLEQSETAEQGETPEQSEVPEQSETPEQNETPAQTVRVLACSYVPHVHTDDCFDESGVLVCGYADYVVHTHNEDCYDTYGNLVCVLPELEEHKHDASCYERKDELVCGLLEGDGHTHDDSCYTVDTTLICGLEETPGHTHSDSCYTVDTTLICGLEESAGHYHDEYCYDTDGNLICGWEESAGHYHTDSCYQRDYRLVCGQEEIPAHYHTDSCYEKNTYLTCGMVEVPAHIHDETCYLSVQQCDKPEIELHRHGEKCYERVYDEEKDEWQKVLVCGKLEVVEHVHGLECFKTVELPPAAVQAEDMIPDGQAIAEFSEDEPAPVQDGSTAVVAGGLQILSVEVVPMETSNQPMPQTVTETMSESETATEALTEAVSESEMTTEALTEAVSESETTTEALTEAVSESETTTETTAEGQNGLQTLALAETILSENEPTVKRALALDEIPMPMSPETQNTAAGVFRFAAIEYTKPGVYRYRISEKNTKEEGIVFDGTVYYATVTVTKNDSGALQSAVELRTVSGNTASEAIFANKYLSPVPEISVSQSVNDGPILEETQNVYEGDVITYYLTVTNSAPAGSASAKDVTVADSIPSGLELMAGSISDGGALENRVITWMLGDIPAGESRTVSFRVTAPQVQTNIVRTNMGNVRAANSPYGANVWFGSNVVRINVLASRPKTPDTQGAEEPRQTENKDQEHGSESESESESENKTTEKAETETDETEAVVPSASDDRSSGGGLGGSSSGGSNESTASSAAKTGDETNIACWLTLMLLAGAVLILLSARIRIRCNVSRKE